MIFLAAGLPPLLLPGVRAASLFALALAFGLLLVAWLARLAWHDRAPEGQAGLERALLRAACAAAVLAGIGHALWLAVQAQAFSGAGDFGSWLQALGTTTVRTGFGHGWTARALLLAGLALGSAWLSRRTRPAGGRALASLAAAAALALALQVLAGHAAGAHDSAPAWALAAHVLAASAWIGALPGLLLALAWPGISPRAAGQLLAAFSRAASAVLAVLLATGWWQAWHWIGGPLDGLGGWLGTPYGRAALAKLGLSAVLLALAALHRWWLTPLLQRGSAGGRRALLAGIGCELLLGLAAFGVAGHLASLPPALHEQPVWPYALRPDWRAWDMAYARRELWRAGAFAALALAALAWIAVSLRQRHLPGPRRALLAGAGILGCAALAAPLDTPNVRLWLRPAYASSYQHSPTGYGAEAIARGEARVRRDCRFDCFTPRDDATDLSPYNIWGRADGDLYGWLLATFDTLGHSPFAPGYIRALEPRQRWELIDYFRARVAARSLDAQGTWRGAYPAPGLALDCGGQPASLADLRGRVLRIIALADAQAPVPRAPALSGVHAGVVVVQRQPLPPPPPLPASGGDDDPASSPGRRCQASGEDAWTAYAAVSGLDPGHLGNTEIVVDAHGWLRRRWTAQDRPADAELARALREIQARPLPAGMAPGHPH